MTPDSIEKLFGLQGPRPRFPFSIVGAFVDPSKPEVRISLSAGGDHFYTVMIRRPVADSPFYLKTPHLLLLYQGEELDELLGEYLNFLAQSLCDVRFEALKEWARESYPQEPVKKQEPTRQDSPVLEGHPYSRGTPEYWHSFISMAHRAVGESIRLRHRVAGVQHQDPECMVCPDVYVNPIKFIKYPWNLRSRWKLEQLALFAPEQTEKLNETVSQVRVHPTNMNESDVIMGGTEKVVAAIEELAGSPWHEIGTLSFTCTPMVIGDDVTTALRSYAQKTDRPLIYAQEERNDPGRPVIRLLQNEFNKAECDAPAKVPGSFNLVGYPAGILEEEIGFLDKLGVRKQVRLLPDIYLPDCREFLQAEVQVVDDKQYLRPFLQQVFADLPVETLKLSPPLGFRGTRDWCRTIAARFDKAKEFERQWPLFIQGFKQRWERLHREAQGHCLGFILDADQVADFFSGALFQNTPIYQAVAEMGFDIELLVFSERRMESDYPVSMNTFSTPRQLEQAIGSSRAAAFYSEYYYDWRLTSCGKAGFSFHDLEYGLPGAIRNLQFLLNLCKMTFYRRYAGFLQRPERWDALHQHGGGNHEE